VGMVQDDPPAGSRGARRVASCFVALCVSPDVPRHGTAARRPGCGSGPRAPAAIRGTMLANGVDADQVLRLEGVPPVFAFGDQDGGGMEITGQHRAGQVR